MRRLLARTFSPILAAAALAAATPLLAYEVVPAEKRIIPWVASLPTCGDPSVLADITSKFAEKETKYWNSDLKLLEYLNIKAVAFRPWGLDTIPRRFCSATVTVSDGRRRRIDYSVREDLDFIGNGWGVEWCVTGLDRNFAYSPACKMARP